ncbi:DUF6473 family protein [Sulfitobacter guttiformis]|uniref:DUF6473 domain-containing protein n=1 Tax=Sulfitobacter guttiformis TaxID=74349 RepID=A0A420DR06_9RHOB|nr:DUF6473 family protein [Sulfitobacter guttiformis]KIN73930.1 hypothetical protein Z949_3124 [Sulfitobacter guttiformis KCTC 32187]RKE96557.1 hypothetical protein C8N30_1122 [Sulfitobacter guttiformis]
MTYDILGPGALDYLPCRYGTSKLTFRGPLRTLTPPYVAFLGGTATFGKFIEQPYPLRVEHMTGVTSVNFGQVNAGLDVFAKDLVVIEAAKQAHVIVVEVLGAANMTNPLYSVHPRRNDRFLRASAPLMALYPDVDFSDFTFTHHMLRHLCRTDSARFGNVRQILQKTWVRRMRRLLVQLSSEVILLRIGGESPSAQGHGPLLITDDMIDRLLPSVSAFVDVPSGPQRDPFRSQGMVFGLHEEDAARGVPQPHVHADAAQALRPVLDRLL